MCPELWVGESMCCLRSKVSSSEKNNEVKGSSALSTCMLKSPRTIRVDVDGDRLSSSSEK